MDNRPIGIFDSGLGGLTVLSEIIKNSPNESVVYFGDCGRTPYGNKSKDTVIKYAFQDIRFLLNQDIKSIVIACNTVSAYSLSYVKKEFNSIHILEVIGPGSKAAVEATKNKKIGVIGTNATISSGVYENAIRELDNSTEVYSKACPLFVPLVEEGWWNNEITYRTAQEYLLSLKEKEIDTLVLGCTHYPLIKDTIQKVVGENVKLVSSATEISKMINKIILDDNLTRDEKIQPVYRYYTTDSVEKFEELGSKILGHSIFSVEKVDIEKY
ncbi:MAG: glutamate racemase [Clostridiales bacterium]